MPSRRPGLASGLEVSSSMYGCTSWRLPERSADSRRKLYSTAVGAVEDSSEAADDEEAVDQLLTTLQQLTVCGCHAVV